MQTTEQPVREYSVPNLVRARIRDRALWLKTSDCVRDTDEVMFPVWDMVRGKDLTLEATLTVENDDTLMFGSGKVRVYEISEGGSNHGDIPG